MVKITNRHINLRTYTLITLVIITAAIGSGAFTFTRKSVNKTVPNAQAQTTNTSDINSDGKVDVFDLSILLSNWGTQADSSDINKDSKVDVFDLSILLSNWGASASLRPLVIKHGWDIVNPTYVKNNVSRIDLIPVDGMIITLPNYSTKVRSQTPISYEEFKAALAPLAGLPLKNVKHNFAMAYSAPSGDYFDDWSVPINNFANLAKAANEVGLEGIVYDNEEYFGNTTNWPDHCPNHTLIDCQNQVRLRGKQIMDAMRTQWPDIRVLTMHGPWISEPLTYPNWSKSFIYYDLSWANELMGPMVIGMIESAAGTNAKVVDGGEIYTPRTSDQFAVVRNWQKEGMATNSNLIPTNLKPVYAQTVSSAHGIYDSPWQGIPMDVNIWKTTIKNAMANADDYVWLYTEKHDWWGSGYPSTPVPTNWIESTRQAISEYPQ